MKFLATALLLLALGQPSPGVSGKWSGFFYVRGSEDQIPQLFVLTEKGTTLAGTGGPDASERYPIAHGTIDGNHVTFDLSNDFAKFVYDLTDSGNQLKGKLIITSGQNTRTADVVLRKSQ